jgi:hypothetical protein
MCMCKALRLYIKGVRTECWLFLGMVICESIDQILVSNYVHKT